MIDKIGIKTTVKERVAYKELPPGANDIVESARFSGELHKAGARPRDPTMVFFYGSKDDPSCKKEVMIPIDKEVDGLDTKMMPEIKVGFIVFSGTYNPVEYYYEKLEEHIKEHGYSSTNTCTIEATFQPDEYNLVFGDFIDEDSPETWKTELMIQVE
jgi:effector-binding domain-containing protein